MFNIDPAPTFTAPVPLSIPGLDQPLELEVTFRHQSRAQLAAWILAVAAADAKNDDAKLLKLLFKVISGWSGMVNKAGASVAFSLTAFSTLLGNYTPARGEFYRAYVSELTEAKKKIS